MGLPKIEIDFIAAANTAIERSVNGIVALILEDNTKADGLTNIYELYDKVTKSHWSVANYGYIGQVFEGRPKRVIVERKLPDENYDNVLARLKHKRFNYLAVPGIAEDDVQTIADWIKKQRAAKKTVKAVLPNCAANDEGIINFATEGVKVDTKTYTAAEFCARIAGLLAGTPLSNSCTYAVFPEVTSITESLDPDGDIDAGKLILINDGEKIKIGRGVNSLATLSGDKTEEMKKIKIIDGIDLMRDDIRESFENNYIGVGNSYDNKILFVNAVNQYFDTLAKNGVLYDQYDNRAEIDVESQREFLAQRQNVSDWSDTDIKLAATGSELFIMANVKFQDAIEDLNFKIYM